MSVVSTAVLLGKLFALDFTRLQKSVSRPTKKHHPSTFSKVHMNRR